MFVNEKTRMLATKKNRCCRQKITLSNIENENENENAIDRSNKVKIEANLKLKIKQK